MTSSHSELQRQTDSEEAIDHEKAQRGIRLLLEAVGEDPDRDGLVQTWQRRVPDAFATLTEGQRESSKPAMRTFDAQTDDLVVKTDIPIYSLCEHHLLPFFGTVHVAYRPDGEVVGLSKLTRYIRWRSRQLTMQEELTNEIASGLADELNAPAVLIEMDAKHLCEAMRGVETESRTVTTASVGDPNETERERFREIISRGSNR